MRLKCVFVLKIALKEIGVTLQSIKKSTSTLAHQDDTKFHHPAPSLAVVGGSVTASGRQTLSCRRVGPRLNENPFGSQAVTAQF